MQESVLGPSATRQSSEEKVMSESKQQACAECTAHKRSALEQVGEIERDEYFEGKAQETRTHFVCRLCGAKWEHLVESGVGGHGSFWTQE